LEDEKIKKLTAPFGFFQRKPFSYLLKVIPEETKQEFIKNHLSGCAKGKVILLLLQTQDKYWIL
jgi:hypothetical protein